MIKNIFIASFVLFTVVAEAQMMNRRQRVVERNPVTTQNRKPPEFNVEKAIGLTIYDVDEVIKKLSLKESDENYKKIITVFNTFNRSQREVSRIHSFSFTQAKNKIETAQKEVMKSRDYAVLEKAYKEVSEGFVPLSDQMKEKEKALDESLKPLLSSKQFKKWKKLQLKIKRKG